MPVLEISELSVKNTVGDFLKRVLCAVHKALLCILGTVRYSENLASGPTLLKYLRCGNAVQALLKYCTSCSQIMTQQTTEAEWRTLYSLFSLILASFTFGR